MLVFAALAACSSSAAKPGDAATTNDVGQAGDVAPPQDMSQTSEVPADAALVPPDNVSFPDMPEMACGGGPGDCQFPPSACADPSCDGGICAGFQWVVYYDNPMCVNGKCAYTKKYFECDISSYCSMGGCRFNGTLP